MRVSLNSREYAEIRQKVQLIETIIDGACQQKVVNKARLSNALSAIRSIQTKYFPQTNYSLNYFKRLDPDGRPPLDRRNFRKYRKLQNLKKNRKLQDFAIKEN